MTLKNKKINEHEILNYKFKKKCLTKLKMWKEKEEV